MLILLSLTLFALAACVIFLMPFLLGMQVHKQYSGTRVVACPENRRQVAVSFDAVRAARTVLVGNPSLRIADCTRWPERANCRQECMPEALLAGNKRKGEVACAPGSMFHLPVFLAAFVGWLIGAFWHSQYLFRVDWRDSLGLSRSEVHELGWQLTPHLLTFAAPLLFAYGVAMVLAWIGRRGPILGAAVSILMWAVLVVALFAFTSLGSLSRDFVRLELGYTLIAAVVIGLTIGELNQKLFRKRALH